MTTLREKLEKKLTKKELELLKTSFDVVGSIIIIEIPDELKKKQKVIANELLDFVPAAKTVLKKAGQHSGEYRTQKLVYLAGERTKETCHKENNVTLCLDVEKVYFSVRSATERLRIAELVKPKEKVLVLFSGCAPYPCVISKRTGAKVTGIELNPIAHKYAEQNISLNKLSDKVILIKGNAKNAKGVFDRIIMPLPKNSEEYLPSALKNAKKDTIFHLYTFGSEEELEERKKKVKEICAPKKIRILDAVKCGQFSPRVNRWCIDFKLA